MIYEQDADTPKNTPKTAMIETVMHVHPGRVRQLGIEFPLGCKKLCHVKIFYWERQLWPTDPDTDFASDGLYLVYPEDTLLSDPPYEFVIKTWNTDDTYPHTPIVRMAILPENLTQAEWMKMLFGTSADAYLLR